MKWAALSALAAVVLIGPSRSDAANDADRDQQIRSMIEQEIKPQFDEAVATLMKAAKDRGTANNKHEMEMAVDGIKDMLYNKAYGLYRCTKEADGLKGSADEKWDHMKACYKASGLLSIKAFKIMSEYPRSLLGRWEVNCEFKSRLFDAEVEFPPFDFLKATAASNTLLDYDRLIDCLLSNDHH